MTGDGSIFGAYVETPWANDLKDNISEDKSWVFRFDANMEIVLFPHIDGQVSSGELSTKKMFAMG